MEKYYRFWTESSPFNSYWDDINTSTLAESLGVTHLSTRVNYKTENDKLEIAVAVPGHNPKKVEVELTTDRIFVKALRDKEDKSVHNSFTLDVNETLKLHSDFDGLTAKARIEHGILHISVDKKEETKPKKLSIKF